MTFFYHYCLLREILFEYNYCYDRLNSILATLRLEDGMT